MYVEIGGIPQWVQIEGEGPGKPALLIVHGGPGAPTRFASAAWQPWQQHFTLIHWDQRGAGLTYAETGAKGSGEMSLQRIVADGIELAEVLKHRFGHERIIVFGHSWGSTVGVHMVHQRPELFTAFVGTGQLVHLWENEASNYARELAQAHAAGNAEAIAALEAIGEPPYEDTTRIRVLREWADKLTDGTGDSPFPRPASTAAPDPDVRRKMFEALMFSQTALARDFVDVDLRALGLRFEVPMFCIMGTHDQQTPMPLAQRWLAEIEAPLKGFATLEGCHHFVHMNRPAEFLERLLGQLGPVL